MGVVRIAGLVQKLDGKGPAQGLRYEGVLTDTERDFVTFMDISDVKLKGSNVSKHAQKLGTCSSFSAVGLFLVFLVSAIFTK